MPSKAGWEPNLVWRAKKAFTLAPPMLGMQKGWVGGQAAKLVVVAFAHLFDLLVSLRCVGDATSTSSQVSIP
jgi:hypothetical protein